MCDADYQSASLLLLKKIADGMETSAFVDQEYVISATKSNLYLDYKKRRHVYMWSPTDVNLIIPDLAGSQVYVPGNSWTEISFRAGQQIFAAAAQTSDLLVKVRATDEQIMSGPFVGSIPYHNLTANSTNFTNVKTAPILCYGLDVSNTSASAIFVKLYDKASTPGTGDTPKRTIQVPANGTVIRAYPEGMQFKIGFGWAATGAVADNDNTNIAANCVVDFNLNG